jgi:hypothetical protein
MIIGLLLFGIPAAIIARSKGFKALRWLIAFGLIGLIVVSCLAKANALDITLDESSARAAKANTVGAWMSGICLGLSAIISVIVILVPLGSP